jgi:opacity protein-like surface antigen
MVTPYLGVNVAGDVETSKGGPGVSIGYVGGLFGFELDVQRYHHFFKDSDVSGVVPDPRIDLDTDATSVMGNVVAPIRLPRVAKLRPYGAAGFGMIRTIFDTSQEQADADQNNFGFNIGGGMIYSFNDRVGLRGDLRYFRALVDEEAVDGGFSTDYGFWRAGVGVTFQFPN